MRTTGLKFIIPLLLVGLSAAGLARADSDNPVPALRVPKLAKAPTIDGKIDPAEWSGAAAVTGFANFESGGPGMSLPQSLQPVWYVGYDDQNLYLAFRYPVFPAGSLRAKAKTKAAAESQFWDQSILVDDHTEIEICTGARDTALSGNFYKFMTNPWDVISDQNVRYQVGQKGYEFESSAVAKSSHTDAYWEQELAIPIKELDENRIKDGDRWVMQLVSAQDPDGNYYVWSVASWLQFHLFPEIIFDSQAAAVQFVAVGDWMAGNPDLTFRLANPHQRDIDLDVRAQIVSPDGQTLLDQKRNVSLKAGEQKEVHIAAQGLPLGDLLVDKRTRKDNMVHLLVTDAQSGAVYYRHTLPLRKSTSPDVQGYLKNLRDARKPAEAKLQFAYMPSFHKLTATADVGILGIDPKLAEQAKYLSAWFKNPAGEILGRNTVPLNADGTAELAFEFLPLPEGRYDVNLEIQDSEGQPLVSKRDTFERRKFAFESFRGGLEDVVVPPYTAVKEGAHDFSTIGNHYELSEAGMIAQVSNHIVPPAAGRDLLAAPMQLVLHQDGQAVPLTGQGFTWDQVTPTRAKGHAEATAAGLRVRVNAEADYTGQYLVSLDLIPTGQVPVDSLDLVMPLQDPVDTVYMRGPSTGSNSSSLFTKARPYSPDLKPGLLWSNLSEGRTQPYIVYMGNGERGLYWYTDSYEGFWIDRHKPHIFIEKQNSATSLRVSLINKQVVLDHPRHLRFAFLAVPTKPLPSDARSMSWDSDRMHAGGGAWWGTIGCFTFPRNDQEWQDWMAGKPFTYHGKPSPGKFSVIPRLDQTADGRYVLKKDRDYGAYRAADLIGYLQPEFKVFAGEWVGETNPRLLPDPSLLNYKDREGKTVWPEPEQRAVYTKDPLTQSFYDFEAYQFYLLAKNTGIGGYWWDWDSLRAGNSPEKGSMYLNDEGRYEPRLNLFMVRAFYERIARIVQELGVRECNNVYAPGAVYQMPWLTRISAWESLYLESDLEDMFDVHGVDKYRTIIGKYSGIPVQVVMNTPIKLDSPRARSVLALALLHDNGIYGSLWSKPTRAVLDGAGVLDDEAVWVPYWRSQVVAKADQPDVLITAYQNPRTKSTTLVVVNPGSADVATTISLNFAATRARDAETSQSVPIVGSDLSQVTVKSHGFRLLVVN